MGTAPGRKKFQRVQFGKEASGAFGTAVNPTTRWRGAGSTIDDNSEIEDIGAEELVGIIGGTDRDLFTLEQGALTLEETPLTPEQIQYINAMAFAGPTTGVADGAGSGFIYQTDIPYDETNTPNVTDAVPYTIETGDDRYVRRLVYSLCTGFKVKADAGKSLKVSADIIGQRVIRYGTTFTATSLPAVTDLAVGAGRMYLDPVSGSYGTTLASGTIVSFEMEVKVMWNPVPSLWGEIYPEFFKYVGHEITGKITFEHDTVGLTADTDFLARTPKLLRAAFTGTPLTSGGTAYSDRMYIIDLPIKYNTSPPLEDKDGNDIMSMAFRSRYNATAGNAGKFIVVNQLASLP